MMYLSQTLILFILRAQLLSHVRFSDPIDSSLLGSYVNGISQARILEWVAISFSRGSSQSRDRTHVSCIHQWILYHWATWEALLYTLNLYDAVQQIISC